MKYNYIVPLLLVTPSIASAKNVFDYKDLQMQDQDSNLEKRDAKRITSDQDLRISEDKLNDLFNHQRINPLKKRSGIIIEPNVQVVDGSVEEINAKQKLFEQGVDVMAQEREQQKFSNDEVHIIGQTTEQDSTNTLANIVNSNKEIHIFSTYIRSHADIDTILNDPTHSNIIVLTPTDDAIAELPLKPWQYPNAIDNTNNERDETSNGNIEYFIKSHVITDSTTKFDAISSGAKSGVLLKTMNGNRIKLYRDEESNELKISVPGYNDLIINVVDVRLGDNGVSLTIDHVLEWPGM